MAKIQPGQVLNPKGRPKGTKNKATVSVKNTLAEIVGKEFADGNIYEALAKIRKEDAVHYLNVISKFLPYIAPRQTESEVNVRSSDFNIKDVVKFREDSGNGRAS